MFISVELENIGPYTEKVVYDFKANKKDKKNIESTRELPDGTIISKVIGVIAGNACGKSSFIDSIATIGGFLSKPLMKKDMLSIEDFSKKENISSLDQEMYENYYNSFLKINPLIDVNMSKETNIGKIALEMYIDCGNEYEGYYKYTISYDKDVSSKGVIEEKLEYKKKLGSKYHLIVSVKGNKESEIGYKLAYRQNWVVELESMKMDTKSFIEKMNYYETFYNRYIEESSILHFQYMSDEEDMAETVASEKELFIKIIKTVDSSVKDIEVDLETKNKKIYILYDSYKLRYGYLSTATKKVFDFAYSIIETTKKGGILLADEFDSSLNRKVSEMLIKIYCDSKIKKSGQFIFTVISPELLESLRRDQIFILTKEKGVIKLTRFSDFKNPENGKIVRNDFSFTKAYKNNIIKNYPIENSIYEFIEYMEKR